MIEIMLVFLNIFINIGGGYNVVIGIFMVLFGGVYIFNCKLIDNQNSDGFSIYFVKNGVYQGFDVGNKGFINLFRFLFSLIVLEFIFGDRVWVKVVDFFYYFLKIIVGE